MYLNYNSDPKRIEKYDRDKNNYRGIALSSLFCKLFDHCIIRDQLFALKTDDLQFHYKASTVQCVSMVQETITYYINNGSHVVICVLAASQSFDRVNLLTSLKKLHRKETCPVHLKTLIQLYRTKSLRINWNG